MGTGHYSGRELVSGDVSPRAPRAQWLVCATAAISLCCFQGSSRAAITPVYQNPTGDAFWTEVGSSGQWQVATDAEDWVNEIWERPAEDNKWTDIGGNIRRTNSDGKYYAYGDLTFADFGVGNSMGDDYLFVRWDVNGDFEQVPGSSTSFQGLKSHYYFYFEVAGELSRAVEVNSGVGLDPNFGDPNNLGIVNVLTDTNDDVPGSGINVTGEGGDSHEDSAVAGEVRANGLTLEVAVLLSDLGLKQNGMGFTLADFANMTYAFAGTAVSNPSSPGTDLFANDFFNGNVQGQGVEYDTVRFNVALAFVPEPASMIFGLAVVSLSGYQLRRRRRLKS